ncbi:MAG: penicillin acylase family protein, partial [Pseudomonadota bacterium]
PDLAQEFLRPYPDGGHVSMEWEDLARTLGLERAGRPSPQSTIKIRPGGENSNNWVVSGSRSVSGSPMLANDPHLGLTMPGFWHLVQMRIGDAVRSGGTIAGMPAIVIGHNEAVSWGTTNGQDTDVQDVYLEQLNPGASTEYETPNGWASFQIREETITVRFGQQVVQRYRQTERGPVMEPSAIPFPIPETEGGVYSLRWTALEGKDLTLSAIMAINRAQSAQDVRDSANLFAGPPQNIVYAHRDGDIGLVVAGKTPIRLDSHETKGAAPADGWRPENQWQGFIPDALMPHVANPKSGMLVTANAKVVPPQYPYFRSVEAADPSRQRRIDDLLKATTKHDLLSFAAIQTDTLAPVATALLPFMKAATPVDEDAALALTLLDGWNGDWSADSAAPVIFAQWASLLTQALIWDELGDLAPGYAWLSMRRLADVLGGPIDSWCDDRATADRVETCDTLLSETLSATAAALLAENAALDSLRWSDIQRDTHGHIGLAAIPLLGDVLSRETNRSAGPDSPNVSSLRVDTLPRSAGGGFGPSMRFIIDMAQPNEARFSISSGQSGHFASPHYDDLQTLWAAGDYVRFDEASARAGKKIVLLPAQ